MFYHFNVIIHQRAKPWSQCFAGRAIYIIVGVVVGLVAVAIVSSSSKHWNSTYYEQRFNKLFLNH